MVLVSERSAGDGFSVSPCDGGPGLQGLAGAAGIAWRPEDLPGLPAAGRLYLRFDEWLG